MLAEQGLQSLLTLAQKLTGSKTGNVGYHQRHVGGWWVRRKTNDSSRWTSLST